MANGSTLTYPFQDTYRTFLHIIKKGLKPRLILNQEDEVEVAIVDALLNTVIHPLSEAAGDMFNEAFTKLSNGGQEALNLEIALFNHRYAEDVGDTPHFANDARTVKDSLEDLFSDWLKDKTWVRESLKILNELLGLVRD